MNMNNLWVRRLGGVLGLTAVMAGMGADAWARHAALDAILAEAQAVTKKGLRPAVIMDLDETVVDTVPRKWAAFRAVTDALCFGVSSPRDADPVLLRSGPDGGASFETCEALGGLSVAEIYSLPNRYDDDALARAIGLEPKSWDWADVKTRWLAQYLSGQFEYLDQPMAGAYGYVGALKRAGAHVWYVSSRWQEEQGASTQASLLKLGLIGRGEEGWVILRPRGMNSIDFKRMAYEQIRKATTLDAGQIVGLFENEPENIEAMSKAFPGVPLVFVEGAWLKPGAVPAQAARIVNYR